MLSTLAKKNQALHLAIKIECHTILAEVFLRLTVAQMNGDEGVAVLLKELDSIVWQTQWKVFLPLSRNSRDSRGTTECKSLTITLEPSLLLN